MEGDGVPVTFRQFFGCQFFLVLCFVLNNRELYRLANLWSSQADARSIGQSLSHMFDQFANAVAANLVWTERPCGIAQDRLAYTGYLDPHFSPSPDIFRAAAG